MNYLNRHILYSPLSYGGSEGGGGGVAGGGIASGKRGRNQGGGGSYSLKINNISVSKKLKSIKPKGEKRIIKITGTPGATFSLNIKDSTDCSILREEIQNVKIPRKGIYELKQDFPSILTDEGAAKTKEVYDITLTPAADVELVSVTKETPTIQLYQYADPVITVTHGDSISVTGASIVAASTSNVTITGPADTYSDNISNYSTTTYTNTITNGGSGSFYVKSSSFSDNITSNTVIKKKVNRNGETGLTDYLTLKPLTTRVNTTIEGDRSIGIGDLEKDMRIYAKINKTKTVKASLDKDDNILDYSKCGTVSNKIELSDTNNLVEGMSVSGKGIKKAMIVSINCDKRITLSKKQIIPKDTELTFKKEWRSAVVEVVSQRNADGDACVKITTPLDIPNGTEIEFDDDENVVHGSMTHRGSGTDSIVLTTTLTTVKFGLKNVIYTLDLDSIITKKPHAGDKRVSGRKNNAITIYMLKNDVGWNAAKTGTEVRKPTHGSLSSYHASGDTVDAFIYTPNANFTGEDSFTFTMSDGTTASEEKTVRITIK